MAFRLSLATNYFRREVIDTSRLFVFSLAVALSVTASAVT